MKEIESKKISEKAISNINDINNQMRQKNDEIKINQKESEE